MIETFLAVHGNRSKRGYGSTYNPVSTVNMCYASVYGDFMVLQMVCLYTALNLLQNGGRTSGNDVFLVVFGFCTRRAWCLWDKVYGRERFIWMQASLAACYAPASESMMFLEQLRFTWMCMFVVNNKQTEFICCQTAFCIFRELHVVFQHVCGQVERFWSWEEVWEVFGCEWWVVNSSHEFTWKWMRTSFLHRCFFSRRNSWKKTT